MKAIKWIIRIIFFALFILLLIKGKTMLWLILFGVSLPLTLIFGRFYCGYICPMNTAMEAIEGVKGKFKLRRLEKPSFLKPIVPWIALIVSIASMLLLKKFAHISLPIMLIWLGISIILTFFFKAEVFHNYICPFGALQRLFGKFSFFGRKVNNDKCVGCKICVKSCPTNAISIVEERVATNTIANIESENTQEENIEALVERLEKKAVINITNCIQCNNCQEACPKDAISYNLKKK